jgi:mono/diheme cytochrome c family protein
MTLCLGDGSLSIERLTMMRTIMALMVLGLVVGHGWAGDDDLVKRGEYLVNGVGLCADCHTPRDAKGAWRKDKWLMGSTLDFAPKEPMPIWQGVAPYIAGLPTYTDDQAVTLFTTGVGKDGHPLRPPMPLYRLSAADAKAVIAYLRSLAPTVAK